MYAGGSIGSDLFDERDLETYGYDPRDPSPEDDEETNVVVPITDLPLSQASLHTLQASVDPLGECTDNGIQFNRTCVRMVFQAMQSDGLL